MKNRFLAFIVVIILLISGISVSAFAGSVDEVDVVSGEEAEKIETNSSLASEDIPDFEVYNANSRIYGLEGSGGSIYDIMMGTKMVYQELAEYAMEEKALYYSSGLWVSFFDDIFAVHPKYLYETILMAYLNFDANTAEVENTAKQAALEFSVDLASFVLNQGSDAIADKTEAWNEYLKTTSVGDASGMMLNAGMVTDLGDIFDTVVNFSETAEELRLNNLSGIVAVDKKRKQQVAFLEELKARTSDNQYLQEAIGEIVDIYKEANVVSLVKQSGRQIGYMAIKELPGAVWEALEKKIENLDFAKDLLGIMNPVIEGAQLGASGLNMLFGAKTLSKDLMAILTLYIIDSEFCRGLRSLRQNFLNNPTKENAVKFNGAFNSYLEYQIYADQVAKLSRNSMSTTSSTVGF